MNLLEDLNFDENYIIKDTIVRNEKFDIHRIQSKNETSGPYNQDFDEFVVIIKGEAMLNVEGKDVRLKEMDTYFIPQNVVHEVKSTSDECVWLCFAIK